MNFDSPISEDQVEPLVRALLDADGRTVDVPRVRAEIAARLASDPGLAQPGPAEPGFPALSPTEYILPPPLPLQIQRQRTTNRIVRWSLAVAACLAVAVGLVEWFSISATPASAYSLVQSAHSVLAKSGDRCYQVEMMLPKGWLVKSSFLHSDGEKLVWTRGDRFRFVMSKDGEELIWGQDEDQRLWVACDGERGLQYNPEEVPLALSLTLSYLSLDFERLSLDILENFDLKTEAPTSQSDPDVVTVIATAKPTKKSLHFQSARLKIDRQTKVIRSMEMTRTAKKSVIGRVTFTLLNEDPQTDASYTLQDYLAPGARMLDKAKAPERGKLFRKLLL